MMSVKPPILTVLSAHLRADPRKTAVLVVLSVVMIAMYGRWLLGGGAPDTAEASAPAVATLGPPAVSELPASRPAPASRTVISGPPVRDLRSDPFVLDLQRFPLGREEPQIGQTAAVEDPIEKAARSLVLQSTLCGPSPMACINGEFYRPGQRVNGFMVHQVEPARVVLTREGVTVELSLR